MKQTITLTISYLLLICSCNIHYDPYIEALEDAIELNADSIVALVVEVREGELSRYDDALSNLILTRALLKSGVNVASDSLVAPAYDYLLRKGTIQHQALAAYCYGCVCYNKNESKEATQLFLSLLEIIEGAEQNDYLSKLKASAQSRLGDLYFYQGYKEESLAYYQQAAMLFEQIGEREASVMVRFMVAANLMSSDHEESLAIIEELKRSTEDNDFKIWLELSVLNCTFNSDIFSPQELLDLLEAVDYQAVVELSSRYDSAEWSDSPLFLYHAVAAFIYYRVGEVEQALYHTKIGLDEISDITRLNIGYLTSSAEIARVAGDMEMALNIQRIYSHKSDSIHLATRKQLVTEAEGEFRRKSAEELRLTRTRYRLYLWVLFSLLLVVVMVWGTRSYRNKLRKRDEQLADYLQLIDSYEQTTNNVTKQLRESDERERIIKEYLSSRRDTIQQVAATYYTYGESSHFAEKMRQLALSEEMLADVVRVTDLYNDNAVSRLRATYPTWTERNYQFAALVIAGFSPQEISVMLGMTLNGVYTLKSKLKRKVSEGVADEQLYFGSYFK